MYLLTYTCIAVAYLYLSQIFLRENFLFATFYLSVVLLTGYRTVGARFIRLWFLFK